MLTNPLSEVTLQMSLRGGSFVCQLARCMQLADDHNLNTIIQAFPQIMERYDAFASQAAKEDAKRERECLDSKRCRD